MRNSFIRLSFFKLKAAWAVRILPSLFLTSIAFGQAPTASVSGTITDATAAVVPAAKVTVTSVEKGISQIVIADSSGRYHLAALLPGRYELQVQAEGFETELRKGIQLTVGMEAKIDLSLRVGEVTQTTIVSAQAPLVETATGTISGLVDDRAIRDLPLNGRSYEQLISLQSSATINRYINHNSLTGRQGFFSVAGQRASSNSFLLDGTEIVGAEPTDSLPGGALGKNMGVDAIQEFTVMTSNYSAAYGKRAGGVVNMITRSGGNDMHGTAFEFLRNDNLDARNFFDRGKPEFKRNQFGASLGGPIHKDKTFYFGSYEGLRETMGVTHIAIVPDDNARLGLLPDPQRPGEFTNIGLAPQVRPYLALFPVVNERTFGDGTGEHLSSPAQISRQDFFLVRMDHRLSDRDSFFGRYNFSDANLRDPDLNPNFAAFTSGREQALTVEARRTGPTMLNMARIGFTRTTLVPDDLPVVPIDPLLYFVPGARTIGSISFGSSLQAGQALTMAGTADSSNRFFVVNQIALSDQFFWYRGAHKLQFGGTFQRFQRNEDNVSSKRGSFQFTDLAGFLQGRPTQFQGPDPSGAGDSTKAWRQSFLAIYVQDDLALFRTLTVNLGIRWEVFTAPTEASGDRISNFYYRDYLQGFPVVGTQPYVGAPFIHTNYGTVAPRFGFAWDIAGNGKTALRGGFGIFYDQLEKELTAAVATNGPFFSLLQVANPPFPAGFSGGPGRTPVPSPNGVDPDADVPTRISYNLGIEREVTPDTLVSIAYVGTHGYHLVRQFDGNTAVPTLVNGAKFYATATRKNPLLGSSRLRSTDVNSYYNSLQLDLTQRLSHGLRYKVSYTFSKTMDEASNTGANSGRGNPNATLDADDLKRDLGLSGFDVRHNFVANLTFDLPGRNAGGVMGRAIAGWQFSTVTNLASGQPFTVVDGFNQSRDQNRVSADRPDLRLGGNNNPVLGGPDHYYDSSQFLLQPAGSYGNVGRNTITGPGMANVDFTLTKRFALGETLKLDFRTEFFNLFNRANFGLPDQSVFNTNGSYRGAAGRISDTVTTSRQVQFGLKLLF